MFFFFFSIYSILPLVICLFMFGAFPNSILITRRYFLNCWGIFIWQRTLFKLLFTFSSKNIVEAHFCEPISKSPWERKPNKNQGPKAHQKDLKARKFQRRNIDLPQICDKLQICSRIQFFGRMASTDKDKLDPRPFWSSQHYLAHKGPNPFV